jgi:hypothetical protein
MDKAAAERPPRLKHSKARSALHWPLFPHLSTVQLTFDILTLNSTHQHHLHTSSLRQSLFKARHVRMRDLYCCALSVSSV